MMLDKMAAVGVGLILVGAFLTFTALFLRIAAEAWK